MFTLKPQICEWLHASSKEIKQLSKMIMKGWENFGTTRAFTSHFQL
jgi:hypothetical protein